MNKFAITLSAVVIGVVFALGLLLFVGGKSETVDVMEKGEDVVVTDGVEVDVATDDKMLVQPQDVVEDVMLKDDTSTVVTEGTFDDFVSLEAVAPYKGGGMADRSFDGAKFQHVVVAQLEAPASGKFYEGWLVKKIPTLTFFSTGKLVEKNGLYTLDFSGSQAFEGYDDVVITEETLADGLDGKPEAHVLEGTF